MAESAPAPRTDRPTASPSSVALCGMRDVRDYKAASGGGPIRMGSSSPFNIKEESLRLGNFTEAELHALYAQIVGGPPRDASSHQSPDIGGIRLMHPRTWIELPTQNYAKDWSPTLGALY